MFRALNAFKIALDQNIYDKHSYFEHLASAYGYRSGFQRNASGGLCPAAHDGAKMAFPSCLVRGQGVRFAVFVGDSLTREAAWSFARLAAASAPAGSPESCQFSGGDHERWSETKRDPSFTCVVVPPGAAGPAICGPDSQAPPVAETGYARGAALGNVSDCCDATKFSLYFHDFDFDDPDVHALVARYRAKCPCPMFLYLSLGGMHRLLGEGAFTTRNVTPAPDEWSFPWGRPVGVSALLDNVTAGGAFLSAEERRRVVVASTPAPELAVLMMHPPKFDWRAFAQYGALGFWADADRRATAARGFTYGKYYEASRAFRGLQCDGIHFGNSWETVRSGGCMHARCDNAPPRHSDSARNQSACSMFFHILL
jgi:hypothetical protein